MIHSYLLFRQFGTFCHSFLDYIHEVYALRKQHLFHADDRRLFLQRKSNTHYQEYRKELTNHK